MLDVVVSVFAMPISSVSLPLFASSQTDIERVRRVFLRMTEALCWLLVPPCLTLVFWGPVILTFVFGQKWQASGALLQIFAVQGIILGMFYLYDPLLVALGRTKEVFALRCWQTGLSYGCMLIAAPFGIQAIVAAQVVGLFLTAPIMFVYISAAIDLPLASFLKHLWKPNVFGGAFVAVVVASERSIGHDYGIVGLLGALSLSYLLYCAAFCMFGSLQLRKELFGVVQRISRA
jgi:O-antigen/teichoic acid export membrane protein